MNKWRIHLNYLVTVYNHSINVHWNQNNFYSAPKSLQTQCSRQPSVAKLHTIYDTAAEPFIKDSAVYHNPYCKQENAAKVGWVE